MKKSEIKNEKMKKSESTIRSRETCPLDEISKIVFRGVKMKKSEIRLKSETYIPIKYI